MLISRAFHGILTEVEAGILSFQFMRYFNTIFDFLKLSECVLRQVNLGQRPRAHA